MENLNKVFAYFLTKIGVEPKFRKTEYGYRTYNGAWKLFGDSLSIVHSKPAKVFNGYDYSSGIEESKWQIIKKERSIDIVFLYKKLIGG